MPTVASLSAAGINASGCDYTARKPQTTRSMLHAIGPKLGLSVLAGLFLVTTASAQSSKIESLGYYTGAKLANPDQLKNFPQAAPRRGLAPAKVDLSGLMPPVGDQAKQSSCVAWSSAYALRSYYLAKNEKLSLASPANIPSPAYVYNHANFEKGVITCRSAGMAVWNGLEILKSGVVSMADMPYAWENCSPAPDSAMQARAKKFRIDAWEFVDPTDIESVKGNLAAGNPVEFAISLAPSFAQFKGNGVYTRPANEKADPNDGHALVLIGYDDARKAFLLQNSWTTAWGDKGRAWIAYDTFKTDVNEAYIIYPGTGN
jgi:C1A family cysteine protease